MSLADAAKLLSTGPVKPRSLKCVQEHNDQISCWKISGSDRFGQRNRARGRAGDTFLGTALPSLEKSLYPLDRSKTSSRGIVAPGWLIPK